MVGKTGQARTPPIAIVRAIISLAASKRGRRHISIHDVHVAFFHADIDEWIIVIPPKGLRRPNMVWQLRKAMYGTRKAAQSWQEFVAKVFKEYDWIRIPIAAGTYHESTLDITSGIHGDDLISEGEEESLDILDAQLAAHMDVKCLGRLGPDGVRHIRYLKRDLYWTTEGFFWVGDEKHVIRLVEMLGLQDSKASDMPGSKATGKSIRDALDELPVVEAKLFQQAAGLLNYIAIDRPDIQYSVKVILTDMSKPLVISMLRVKRCVRYLKGKPSVAWVFAYQTMPKAVLYETDSDWAECEITRKSTSSVYGFFGKHLLETCVASQSVVALSSGEAEFYAIGRGAASAIMMRQFFEVVGIEVKAQVNSDSSAARGIATRIGSGRVRHLHIRDLWVQERIREGELHLGKVGTEENRSDMGTKYLDGRRIEKLMESSSLRVLTKGLLAAVIIDQVGAESIEGQACTVYQYKQDEKFVQLDSPGWGPVIPVLCMAALLAGMLVLCCIVEHRLARIVRKSLDEAAATAAPKAAATAAPDPAKQTYQGEEAATAAPTTSSAAATAAPTSLGRSQSTSEEVVAAIFNRTTVPELKVECAWRGIPVSGLKQDLIRRLRVTELERTWTGQDGFLAAAWVERTCGIRAPLQVFRSDETLSSWVLKHLPTRRR